MPLDRISTPRSAGGDVRIASRYRTCAAVLADDPSDAAAHHAMGLSFCGEGLDFTQALPHLERAADLDPATVRWARDAGVVCAALQRWMECVDRLTPVSSVARRARR